MVTETREHLYHLLLALCTAVSTVTCLWTVHSGKQTAVRVKTFSFLQMFSPVLSTGSYDMKPATHLHLVPRSRMSGAVPALCPICPPSVQWGQLYLLLYNKGPGFSNNTQPVRVVVMIMMIKPA